MLVRKVQNFMRYQILISIVFSGWALSAQPRTNLEMMQHACHTLFMTHLTEVAGEISGKNVLLKTDQKSEFSWVLDEALVKWLEEAQCKSIFISLIPDSVENAVTTILKPIDFSVSYRKFDQGFERKINVISHISILDTTQRLLLDQQLNSVSFDTLVVLDLKSIENLTFDFTRSREILVSKWQKIWEPALLFFTTVGIIYLFYAFRSQ